jgi:hypothetical protein
LVAPLELPAIEPAKHYWGNVEFNRKDGTWFGSDAASV